MWIEVNDSMIDFDKIVSFDLDGDTMWLLPFSVKELEHIEITFNSEHEAITAYNKLKRRLCNETV